MTARAIQPRVGEVATAHAILPQITIQPQVREGVTAHAILPQIVEGMTAPAIRPKLGEEDETY